MPIATPVRENGSRDSVAGILMEYVDGYCISKWMGELFSTLDFGTAYIVNEEGRNIGTAREENYDWITTRYNAQELAKEAGDEATRSIARLEKRAMDGEVGIDTYEWEGQLSYVAYGPLTEADWGFCVGFYGSKFEVYTREVTAVSSRSAGVILVVFLFFLAVILTVIVRNLRKERRYSKMSVTAVTGGLLRPTRAVGILRDITSEHEAELDPLTRLYNKPAVTEFVKAAMQSHSQRKACAFIMLDIDHFKRINDQHGHPAGDRVLCEVAKNLQAVFPKPSLCGRFGGDEFCIYCPQVSSRQELETRLSQLAKNVRAIGIKHGGGVEVSVSVGAVMVHGYAEFEDIYKAADQTLYQAKKEGGTDTASLR